MHSTGGSFLPKMLEIKQNLNKILVKSPTVRTKISKIRPNFTHLFATLTKTQGFTKEKKVFGKMAKISKNLEFLNKISKN